MSDTQGKDTTSGGSKPTKDGKDTASGKPDMSVPGSLKRFYDRYMAPQGEDGHYTIVHDVIVAVVVVMVIITGIYAYTNTWPPVVVVESGSMQHDMETSSLGVIDTGDIVMVKKVDSVDDITPWSIGQIKDYSTYGEYGDVIIYDKNGEGGTPVIHRAIVFIQHNETDEGTHYFDVPEWGIYHKSTIEYYVEELNFHINYSPPRGHDGYLTKGDNKVTNRRIDQQSGISDIHGRIVEQVSIEWVIGVARGEVPWFGLIKLNLSGNPGYNEAPDNSRTNLKISLVLLLGVPLMLNVMYYVFASRYGTIDDEKDGEGYGKKGTKAGDGKGSGGGKGKAKDEKGDKGKSSGGSSREEKVKIGKGGL